MKKYIAILCLFMTFCLNMNAESTVYVFLKSIANTDTYIKFNGQTVCDLNGPIKKTIKADPGVGLNYPSEILESCFRKITVSGDGNITISAQMEFTKPTDGGFITYDAEIPLNIENDKTYYLLITWKGLKTLKIVEAKEKDATKWIQKWAELSPVDFNIAK